MSAESALACAKNTSLFMNYYPVDIIQNPLCMLCFVCQDKESKYGWTPLEIAALNGKTEVAKTF